MSFIYLLLQHLFQLCLLYALKLRYNPPERQRILTAFPSNMLLSPSPEIPDDNDRDMTSIRPSAVAVSFGWLLSYFKL